jgi:hypothetical protein
MAPERLAIDEYKRRPNTRAEWPFCLALNRSFIAGSAAPPKSRVIDRSGSCQPVDVGDVQPKAAR